MSEIKKQFFDTFGIECNISYHQQFNCAQIPRGLEVYKEREKHNRMCKSCPKTISCDECSNNTTLKILNGEVVCQINR